MNLKSQNNNYLNIISKLLALLILYLLQQLPVTVLALATQSQKQHSSPLSLNLIFLCLAILTLVIMIYILQRTQKFSAAAFNWQSWFSIIVAAIFNYTINMILLPLMKTTGNNNVDAQTQLMKSFPVLFIIYAVIIAPITEEIFFRGYLINWFFPDNLYFGAAVSAIIFGLLHSSSDPIYFLSKAILGFVLGFTYIKTKNIKANIILHFINNISAFFVG
ncbi:CPBP family intramembrane glutamic endopeptidase [Bombilactobacillus bombi]|uniref:CPBP family intramembrane glutamic endopeptidase n=1 Tax=Bombilactobacillus bombi TaxID=1303590 RepID=UPI0015E5CED2|nr:type II CAAX endopeptidase family protein [Bombilactobacillus bombi]MBA1434744.1 CPBP family intramembrane metalloprotease [Bombilactobacillus bombi]